jgi:hypothetical protein
MAIKSLGKVTVTTSTTPVRITTNQSSPTARLGVQSVTVTALAGNSGTNVYVGSSLLVPSTLVGCYGIVAKGTTASFEVDFAPAGINANEVYLCSDTDNDAALVVVIEQ